MTDEEYLLEKQYKIAIDARDKLNENYHKWMTYYYVANGAILVAITSLYKDHASDKGILFLSILGIFICILWNFSCKGYYYWSNSWIDIIIALERKVVKDDERKLAYGAFSKRMVAGQKYYLSPVHPANISTPKLTLIFSFVSILSWMSFSIYEVIVIQATPCAYCGFFGALLIVVGTFLCYIILPEFITSRINEKHTIVNYD